MTEHSVEKICETMVHDERSIQEMFCTKTVVVCAFSRFEATDSVNYIFRCDFVMVTVTINVMIGAIGVIFLLKTSVELSNF